MSSQQSDEKQVVVEKSSAILFHCRGCSHDVCTKNKAKRLSQPQMLHPSFIFKLLQWIACLTPATQHGTHNKSNHSATNLPVQVLNPLPDKPHHTTKTIGQSKCLKMIENVNAWMMSSGFNPTLLQMLFVCVDEIVEMPKKCANKISRHFTLDNALAPWEAHDGTVSCVHDHADRNLEHCSRCLEAKPCLQSGNEFQEECLWPLVV